MQRPGAKWYAFPALWQDLPGGHYGAYYDSYIFLVKIFMVSLRYEGPKEISYNMQQR
jgi:hypothetical protein